MLTKKKKKLLWALGESCFASAKILAQFFLSIKYLHNRIAIFLLTRNKEMDIVICQEVGWARASGTFGAGRGGYWAW